MRKKGVVVHVKRGRVKQTENTEIDELKSKGKMISNRWEDVHLEQGECFAWLSCWKAAPTHVVAGKQEMYQQLLQTEVFYHRKVRTSGS